MRYGTGVLMLLLFMGSAFSQVSFFYGGGPNVSFLSADANDEIQPWPRIGFNGSILIETQQTQSFSFTGGVSLESKGERYEVIDGAGGYYGPTWNEADINLLYLQLPLMEKLNLSQGKTQFALLAGPEIGFLLSKSFEVDGQDQSDADFDQWETLDFGISGGLGLEFPISDKGYFVIRGIVNVGLKDGISTYPPMIWKNASSSKNSSIRLVLGFRVLN